MDPDKNCGVCIHSSARGHFCEHSDIVAATATKETPVGVARSASVSACGPEGKLWAPCQCLEPFCDRHGKDRRR